MVTAKRHIYFDTNQQLWRRRLCSLLYTSHESVLLLAGCCCCWPELLDDGCLFCFFFYSCASAAAADAAAVGDEDKIQLKLNWNGVDESMNGHPLLRGVSIYTAHTVCVCVLRVFRTYLMT